MNLIPDSFQDRCEFVLNLARYLHIAGTPAPRLEGAVIITANRLNIHAEVWSNPTGIICSFSDKSRSAAPEVTRVLRLAPGEVNLKLLCKVDDIAEKVIAGKLDLASGREALSGLSAESSSKRVPWEIFAFGLASASVAGLLRTGWADVATAGVIGTCIGVLNHYSSKRPRLAEALEAVAALFATLVATFVASFFVPLALQTVVIASLIVLMPGLTLTTAMAELSAQNWVSGSARLAGATTTLLKLTFGTVFATQTVKAIGWVPVEAQPAFLPPAVEWISLLVASFSFAILFNAARRDFLLVMSGAWIGYSLTRIGGEIVELSDQSFAGGVFFATLGVTAVANAYARWAGRPGALIRLSGIILLVPGSVGFRSLSLVMEREVILGLDTALAVLNALVALVAGLLFGNLLLPPRRNL